jgi:hypothetical protein
MLVDDCDVNGPTFELKLKDRVQPYFERSLPSSICTVDEYPNIHPDAVGKEMPEALGRNVVEAAYGKPGAVRAIYINTANFTYLLAARALDSVTAVYSAGALVNPANYVLSLPGVDGRSYVRFLADQGSNEITFDCTGYSWGVWDSVNGYVQNPAYVLEYFLRFIAEIPMAWIDQASFDDMAALFDAAGRSESARLIMQDQAQADEWARQLLWTSGLKCYLSLDGLVTTGRKDIYNFLAEAMAFEQVDAIGQSRRRLGLTAAVNRENVRWDYYPWQQLFKSAFLHERDNFYEIPMEDDVVVPIPREV